MLFVTLSLSSVQLTFPFCSEKSWQESGKAWAGLPPWARLGTQFMTKGRRASQLSPGGPPTMATPL